jgi:hypothetical protein
MGLSAALTWDDTTNPDEQGMIFQVPFDCKVDAIGMMLRTTDANSDGTMDLFSGAESSPVSVLSAAITFDAAQLGPTANERWVEFNLPAEVSLTRNTDYCLAVRATHATSDIRTNKTTLGNAAYRAFMPAGTTMRNVTRNGGSGAFAGSSTTIMLPMGVRISSVDDGTGTGTGGGSRMIG